MRKQDVTKGGGHESKVNVFKIDVKLWRRGEETNLTQTITDGDLGTGPPAAGGYGQIFENFCNFSYFNAFRITFCPFLEPFERTEFLRFEGQLKKLN